MIEVEGLTMYYGATLAVDNASFNVDKGTILGLLGPNGAGKTTIINILTTQIIPTKGTASIGGFDILKDPLKIRERIGYLPETVPLYLEMEVLEYLRFVAAGRKLNSSTTSNRLKWVVDVCGLRKVLRKQMMQLSKGYRQRVGLAQALIHDPEILILDEPTSGLDPLQIIGIRDLLKELSQSKTIVISTHILQEVSAISDRVVIINEGKIIASGTLADLEKKATDHIAYSIILRGDGEAIEGELKNLERVQSLKPLDPWGDDGCFGFELQCEGSTPVWPELAHVIQERGWLVREFTEKKPTLEETFIALTQSSRKSIW